MKRIESKRLAVLSDWLGCSIQREKGNPLRTPRGAAWPVCRLRRVISLSVAGVVSLITGLAVPEMAGANLIGVTCSGVGAVVNQGDQLPGDGALGVVGLVKATFVCGTADYIASGTLIGREGAKFATTTLTNLLIENVAGGANPATGFINFIHVFSAIQPKNISNASLNGTYDDTSGINFISLADIKFEPNVNVNINVNPGFPIDPPKAMNVNVPPAVAFGGNSGPLVLNATAVDSHDGAIFFELGLVGDAIRLPDSAMIVTVPEPSTALLLGLGGLALTGHRRRNQRQAQAKLGSRLSCAVKVWTVQARSSSAPQTI